MFISYLFLKLTYNFVVILWLVYKYRVSLFYISYKINILYKIIFYSGANSMYSKTPDDVIGRRFFYFFHEKAS